MEWITDRKVERQAIRMHRMMDRLNVNAVALVRLQHGDVYAKARSACLSCQNSDLCLKWLDRQADGTPDFCPILEVLESCRKIEPEERSVA